MARDAAASLQAELQLQQFRILRRQVPVLYAVLSIDTCILAFSVYGSVSATLAFGVPALFLTLMAVRVLVWLTRRRKEPPTDRIGRYLFNTTMLAAIVSLCLGIWGVALLQTAVSDMPFVPLFVAFGSIACAYCLGSLPRAAFATIILATGPVLSTLLISGSWAQTAAGLNLLLILALILRLIRHQFHDLMDMVRTHSEVRALAYTDGLTGLPNRRALFQRLDRLDAATGEAPVSALMTVLDLDGFKSINDTYGHPAGDEVLVQAAGRIKSAAGPDAFVARLGGDEFAVLLPGEGCATAFGDRLLSSLEEPFDAAHARVRLSASVGVASFPEDATTPAQLISRADLAMYEVKHDSRNGVARFTTDMEARLRRRMTIEQALRETSPPAAIHVDYQPVFDIDTGAIRSFEALARWNHPELGCVSPVEFIQEAERTGLICQLSERIFSIAIEEAARWPANVGLSVNLSGLQLNNSATPLMIMSLLDRYDMDPGRLEIEVTETSLLADFQAACEQLSQLRSVGIKIVLDDFGSGYASIAYLKRMWFDRVKIDGDLVDDIVHSTEARRLLDGVLRLCAAIRVPATVEKVETPRQLALLRSLGCDRAQGYLLGRPGDAAATRALIDRAGGRERPAVWAICG